jgi:hypothetical protein
MKVVKAVDCDFNWTELGLISLMMHQPFTLVAILLIC